MCLQLFSSYHVPSHTQFGIQISSLRDILKCFAAIDVGPVSMAYPGKNSELILRYVFLGMRNDVYCDQPKEQTMSGVVWCSNWCLFCLDFKLILNMVVQFFDSRC